MKNKLIIGTGLILTVLGLYLVLLSRQPTEDAKAGTLLRTVDVIGTGTSTTATYKFRASAATTTSSVIVLGQNTDTVDFLIYSRYASTTAHVSIEVLESSLPKCAQTGASHTEFADAISTNSTSGGTTKIVAATSTVEWLPSGLGLVAKKYQIKDVNAHCLKVNVGGTNTNVYIQANLKSLSF